MNIGALILTGGASRRMGEDKAALAWGGQSAVQRIAALARAAGASTVITCGPGDFGFEAAREDPPGGGPVAGAAAGARRLRTLGCQRALLLAVDAPTIALEDIQPLLAAAFPGAAYAHLHLPLMIWLAAFPLQAGAGWSMARLIREAKLPLVEPPAGAAGRLRGANTPEERAVLLAELTAREDAQESGAG